MPEWGAILEAERRGILPTERQQALDEARSRGLAPPTPPEPSSGDELRSIGERARQTFGFKDYDYRGTILPYGVTREGKTEFALPQIGVDIAESFLLPRHIAEGGDFTAQDATEFALDFAAPATARNLAPKATGVTRRQFTRAAPSSDDLLKQGREAFKAAGATGVKVSDDRYVTFLADMENIASANRLTPGLHPKTSSVLNALSKEVGQAPDVGDVQAIRRLIAQATKSVDPDLADDRRIAGLLLDRFDDMVDNLSADDLASAEGPLDLGRTLRDARRVWGRARKSETIEEILENAENAGAGFESGVRNQLRALLKNKKKSRSFTEQEKDVMRGIIRGGPVQGLMRLLGKGAFRLEGGQASNVIGGSIGTGIGTAVGSAVGGPAGAVAGFVGAQGAGAVGRRASEAAVRNPTEYLRALAASGALPPGPTKARAALLRGAERAMPPVIGGLLEEEPRPNGLLY